MGSMSPSSYSLPPKNKPPNPLQKMLPVLHSGTILGACILVKGDWASPAFEAKHNARHGLCLCFLFLKDGSPEGADTYRTAKGSMLWASTPIQER